MKKVLLSLLVITAIIAILGGCSSKVTNTGTKDISVGVIPFIGTISYGDSIKFYANVYNTNNRLVAWYVNNIPDGNDSLGRITVLNDTSAWYVSPPLFAEVTFDSVVIKAISQQDTTKSGKATARILSASLIFVDSASGDDQHGIGSIFHPYRTLTKALSNGVINDGDTVSVGVGTYTTGEIFPLRVPHEVTVRGVGVDSTRIRAHASTDNANAAFHMSVADATIKNLSILGSAQSGVGVYTSGGLADTINYMTVENCQFEDLYTGAAIASPSENLEIRDSRFQNCRFGIVVTPFSRLQAARSRFINSDSIGIRADSGAVIQLTDNAISESPYGVKLAASTSALLRGDTLENLTIAGVYIAVGGFANLGQNSTSFPGNNEFSNFTSGSWCVYNLSADTIYAVYNTWPSTDSATIANQYIFDLGANPTSGPVLFMPIHP
jgi:hypothetical protein